MNSIPQQDVAKGKGQREFFLARPYHAFKFGGKETFALVAFGISAIATVSFRLASFGCILNLTGRDINTI
jgi:hypothetical protein